MNHWGRIFFLYPKGTDPDAADGRSSYAEPLSIFGQPLDNHTGNCRYLLEAFDSHFFHPETRDRLLLAAKLHDDGKRETFRIGKDERGRLTYSFAGHRFRVPRDDPYVAGLIRAHHEFSVEQVNSERAQFSSEADRRRFADDLYLLCMADQLEAELAVKAVEKRETAPRSFMEFTTESLFGRYDAFRVVPWPFALPSLTITIGLKEIPQEAFLGREPRQIEKALKEGDFQEDRKIEITLTEDDFDDDR